MNSSAEHNNARRSGGRARNNPGRPAVATDAAAQLRTDAPPHPATQEAEHLVTPEQIQEWREELSNRGRWGPDDQLGTLNLITPEKRRRALRLAEDGEVVGLLHFVDTEPAVDSHTHVETRQWMPLCDEETGEYAAEEARERLRREFLIAWTLLPLENGTASPFAAAAIS